MQSSEMATQTGASMEQKGFRFARLTHTTGRKEEIKARRVKRQNETSHLPFASLSLHFGLLLPVLFFFFGVT